MSESHDNVYLNVWPFLFHFEINGNSRPVPPPTPEVEPDREVFERLWHTNYGTNPEGGGVTTSAPERSIGASYARDFQRVPNNPREFAFRWVNEIKHFYDRF